MLLLDLLGDLMTFPEARILRIDEEGIRETRLEETDHLQITRGSLGDPERYWRLLREG